MDNQTWIKSLTVAIVGMVGSAVVSLAIKVFDIQTILIGVGISLVIISVYFGYKGYAILDFKLAEYDKKLQKFDDHIRYLEQYHADGDKLSWLLSEDSLLQLERGKAKAKKIWIINPDPSNDTGPSKWVPIIRNNLKEGFVYTYICPKTSTFTGAVNGLKTTFRDYLKQCNVISIVEGDYKKLPYEHLVIYDPYNEHDEVDSFAEIVSERGNAWFRIPVRKRNEIVEVLSTLVSSAKPLDEFSY